MHNYTGNPLVTVTDPPVVSEISDSDDLDEAHLNPSTEQITDFLAALIHFGAAQNKVNIFASRCTFNGGIFVDSEIDYTQPQSLNATTPQTVAANLSDLWIIPKGTLPGSATVVNLSETSTGLAAGARVRVAFQELNTGANVWRFKSNSVQLLTIDNTGFTPDLYTTVEFYFGVDGHWHVGVCSGMVVSIP